MVRHFILFLLLTFISACHSIGAATAKKAAPANVRQQVLIFNWDLVQAIPDQSANPLAVADVLLSRDAATHSLIVSGPKKEAQDACDLFIFLDSKRLVSHLFPLQYADPVASAHALNQLYTEYPDIEPAIIGRFMAFPVEKAILVCAYRDEMEEATPLIANLDRDPATHPVFTPSTTAPLNFDNISLADLKAYYVKTYGFLFSAKRDLGGIVTIRSAPAIKQPEAIVMLRAAVKVSGYVIHTTTFKQGPSTYVFVRLIEQSTGGIFPKPNVMTGRDPEKMTATYGSTVQIVPLYHASPATVANKLRVHSGATQTFLQPAAHSLVIHGDVEDVHHVLELIDFLDQ